jgi:hypothetical protein
VTRSARGLCLAGLGLLAGLAGCEGTPDATAVRLEVEVPPGAFHQVLFHLRQADGVVAQALRPDAMGALLAGPQSAVLELGDDRAGSELTCHAEGLWNGVPQIAAEGRIAVLLHRTVTCKLAIPAKADAGAPAGG